MKRTSTLPYFQLDSGQVLLASMGHTHEEMGLYLLLMATYWEGNCRLPSREDLARKLGMLRSPKKMALLDQVIDEFFPGGVNEPLDQCKANALKTSQRQSANAQKGHAQRRQEGNPAKSPNALEDDPMEF